MTIVGFNKFLHDGSWVLIKDKKLEVCIEGEKDSRPRHANISDYQFLNLMTNVDTDILAKMEMNSTYQGTESELRLESSSTLFGKQIKVFQTSHERAHTMCSYGMSPLRQGEPCYSLCWEGGIGRFSYIDENLNISTYSTVLTHPGSRYAYPFLLTPRQRECPMTLQNLSIAGKMMALTGFASRDVEDKWAPLAKRLVDLELPLAVDPRPSVFAKELGSLMDVEVENQEFKDFSYYFSNEIFDRFYQFAKTNLTKGLPLIISGGCGLNCDWNTAWRHCGLFESVFVPPVTNDSGIAIGAAIDAQHYFTGSAKIEWSVYSGIEFIYDVIPCDYESLPLDLNALTSILVSGEIIAWVQGKYEIGPRALCHRSLFASPFDKKMHDKINVIKNREQYRPIAPVCTEEDVEKYFDWKGPSPYMLQFMNVKTVNLRAVTHVDGTARTQTLTKAQDERTYLLLKAFEKKTGVPILCNTSLNFPGKGFINRMSDLLTYVRSVNIRTFVVNDTMYIRL
jgi:predicted NodU family carbamoyl transferase